MAEESKRIQFLQDALKKLAKAIREVSGGLIDLDKTISKITGSTREFEKEIDKTSSKTKKYKDNLKQVNDEQKKFGKNTDDNNKKSKGFGATLLKNIKTIISFYGGYLLLNSALRLAQTFTIGAIKRFAELEAATARVGAVTGTAGKELEALRKNTLDVAGATTFTAIEIAGLQTELGKLGFSAKEIQASTLPIANAAQALGVGLGDLAQKVGVTLRAFSLDASQAASVADTLTSAINGSALSFESFGTSIGYVAPIAGQLGITVQETAAAMGVLADSGFQASRIGTGLRKILLEVGESGETLKDTLTNLKNEQLSLNDITQIFGKTAVAQATVLLNNIDKLEEYSGEFGKLGSATQASAQQIDTLQGRVQLLNSAFDAFLIRIADLSTIGGTVFNKLFNSILPEAVENQLAAYKEIKRNDFFTLLSENSEKAAENIVKSGAVTADEIENAVRQTLAAQGRLRVGEKEQLLSGNKVIALSEETTKTYNGLIEKTYELVEAKKNDILATEGQERAVSKLTEAGKELVGIKRDEVINQKQALEANRLANIEYENLSTQLDLAKESLKSLTQGSDEYKKTVAEIGKLQTLQQQIAEFQFDQSEIEAIVKRLYNGILRAADKENLEGLTKILNDAFKKELSRLTTDENGQVTTEPIEINVPFQPIFKPEGDPDDPYGFVEQFGDQTLKSFQELMLVLQEEGVSMANDIYQNIAEERLKVLNDQLDAEIDAIKQRYEIEDDILKSQLDNQLLTESQFRQKQLELRKAQLRDENDVEKARFDAEKKQDLLDARSDYLAALAQAFINEVLAKTPFPFNFTNALITSGGAAVAFAGQTAAISQRQFVPRKFAEGGIVSGPSHAEGGVPFSVQGQGGYEMEGGEFIVNKKASAMHRDLLERINNSYRTNPIQGSYKFAQGGLVNSPANESVDYLKAIAEATTSTAIGVSKPVRAYVSDKDLRSNATERRIRDRNDRL